MMPFIFFTHQNCTILSMSSLKEIFSKHWMSIVSIFALLLAINVLFYYTSPKTLVDYIGVENSYLVTFLVAAIGGLNTFTSGVLYTTIATFAAGGSIPWLVGIAGGLGIAIGDSIIFHLVKYGRKSISENWKKWIEQKKDFIDAYPSWVLYLAIYLYLGFSPLPNDLLMFTVAMLGFSFMRLLPVIILGGITIGVITAYVGSSWPF